MQDHQTTQINHQKKKICHWYRNGGCNARRSRKTILCGGLAGRSSTTASSSSSTTAGSNKGTGSSQSRRTNSKCCWRLMTVKRCLTRRMASGRLAGSGSRVNHQQVRLGPALASTQGKDLPTTKKPNSAMRSPCGLTMSGWCRTTQASTGQSAQFYPWLRCARNTSQRHQCGLVWTTEPWMIRLCPTQGRRPRRAERSCVNGASAVQSPHSSTFARRTWMCAFAQICSGFKWLHLKAACTWWSAWASACLSRRKWWTSSSSGHCVIARIQTTISTTSSLGLKRIVHWSYRIVQVQTNEYSNTFEY